MSRERIEAAKKLMVITVSEAKERGASPVMADLLQVKDDVPGLTADELLQACQELVAMFDGQPGNAVLTTVLARKAK
jgi:hypothetical protein